MKKLFSLFLLFGAGFVNAGYISFTDTPTTNFCPGPIAFFLTVDPSDPDVPVILPTAGPFQTLDGTTNGEMFWNGGFYEPVGNNTIPPDYFCYFHTCIPNDVLNVRCQAIPSIANRAFDSQTIDVHFDVTEER